MSFQTSASGPIPVEDEEDIYCPQAPVSSCSFSTPRVSDPVNHTVELGVQPEQLKSKDNTIYWKVDFNKPELFAMCRSILKVLLFTCSSKSNEVERTPGFQVLL